MVKNVNVADMNDKWILVGFVHNIHCFVCVLATFEGSSAVSINPKHYCEDIVNLLNPAFCF